MFTQWSFKRTSFAILLAAVTSLPTGASAISVQVAKKCDVLLAKKFPPREVGNPAAGSSKGSTQVQRDYFKKCVENGGNMDNAADKNPK
jgi:hypothetical protein